MQSHCPEFESPWEQCQFICIPKGIFTPALLQNGWKEQEHSEILSKKEQIAHIESADEWELRKKITNPYEAIFSGSEDASFPSLAKVQPLSRSYFKMIEMLKMCEFWATYPQENRQFISAHICEGPGGFIQHVIEKAKDLRLPIKGIYAMTLKPTKSHIPGWRRSIGFLRKYPNIQLEYGHDDTGNILVPANQTVFCERAAGAHLFTADGGFDFSIDYTKQEEAAFSLLLASFSMGLRCLAKGGTMIIKLFDIYSEATQDLFLGTAVHFKKFTIYKPATSRPCNSERYFIAQGYLGQSGTNTMAWIRHLNDAQVKHAQSPLTRLMKTDWPPSVLAAVQEQIQWQEKLQMESIEKTLSFTKDSIPAQITRGLETSRRWCEVFGVPLR